MRIYKFKNRYVVKIECFTSVEFKRMCKICDDVKQNGFKGAYYG